MNPILIDVVGVGINEIWKPVDPFDDLAAINPQRIRKKIAS